MEVLLNTFHSELSITDSVARIDSAFDPASEKIRKRGKKGKQAIRDKRHASQPSKVLTPHIQNDQVNSSLYLLKRERHGESILTQQTSYKRCSSDISEISKNSRIRNKICIQRKPLNLTTNTTEPGTIPDLKMKRIFLCVSLKKCTRTRMMPCQT